MIRFRRRSHLRTIILAVTAAAAFAYAAIFDFGVDPHVMLQFFVMSGAMLLVAITLGAIAAGVMALVRRGSR